MGVEGVACVTVVAETLMYWDRGVQPAALWCLVDRRVPVRPLGERALAGVELMSPRQRALCLLCHYTLEQCANLMVGSTILRRRSLWKTTDLGHRNGDVLARPGKVREGFIIHDDPPVHVVGHGACAPTVSMALDLLIELRMFLLELESRFLELLVSGFQLLHSHARWGYCLPLGLVIKVVHWGSLLLMDAFDVSLRGTYHEAFVRGVMTLAPLRGGRGKILRHVRSPP